MSGPAYQPLLNEKDDEVVEDVYDDEVPLPLARRRRSGMSQVTRSLLTSAALVAFIVGLVLYGNSRLPHRRRPRPRPLEEMEPVTSVDWPVSSTILTEPLSGYNLRILPIGDSITEGVGGSTYDGYRSPLYDLLAGNAVEMVGSQRSGEMRQNAHEGHSNFRMDQIQNYADEAAIFDPTRLPNIVLLHAGTVDMTSNYALATAPLRLAALLNNLLEAYPQAVIIVAQLVTSRFPTYQERIMDFNGDIPTVVEERFQYKPVHVADMSNILDPMEDMVDTTHPNDNGYAKIALAWLAAIEEVAAYGWINNITDGSMDGLGVISAPPPVSTAVVSNSTRRFR